MNTLRIEIPVEIVESATVGYLAKSNSGYSLLVDPFERQKNIVFSPEVLARCRNEIIVNILLHFVKQDFWGLRKVVLDNLQQIPKGYLRTYGLRDITTPTIDGLDFEIVGQISVVSSEKMYVYKSPEIPVENESLAKIEIPVLSTPLVENREEIRSAVVEAIPAALVGDESQRICNIASVLLTACFRVATSSKTANIGSFPYLSGFPGAQIINYDWKMDCIGSEVVVNPQSRRVYMERVFVLVTSEIPHTFPNAKFIVQTNLGEY